MESNDMLFSDAFEFLYCTNAYNPYICLRIDKIIECFDHR